MSLMTCLVKMIIILQKRKPVTHDACLVDWILQKGKPGTLNQSPGSKVRSSKVSLEEIIRFFKKGKPVNQPIQKRKTSESTHNQNVSCTTK